jgi:hypothetical protein
MSLKFQRTPGTALVMTLVVVLATFANAAKAGEPTVPLGRAGSFAVLAGSSVSNRGVSKIVGNVGVWPSATAVGFPPGTVIGTIYTGNVAAADAQADVTTAYNDAAARSLGAFLLAGDIGGQTLPPGIYRSLSSMSISSGDLRLNAQGNSNAVFIFQVATTFTLDAGRKIVLANGARAGRVFWQVGDSVSIGSNSVMNGNILADQSIDVQRGAVITGHAFARSGEVSLHTSTVRIPTSGPGRPPTGIVEAEEVTPIALNPRTGLFEQTIRVRNAGSNAIAAAQIRLRDLPPDVVVYNASGRASNGSPFVQYSIPLAVDASVDLVIEYFRAGRQPFASPRLVAKAAGPLLPALLVELRQSVLRTTSLGTGRMLVEFASASGGRYAVQYNDDGTVWKTAFPPVTASANRVLWLDEGPPKTESPPTGLRKYRVLKLL